MQLLRLTKLLSVVLVCIYCNHVFAEQDTSLSDATSGWKDDFRLGGYSSASLNFHDQGHVDAALNEVSVTLAWDGGGRFRFFGEAEVEDPLTWNQQSDRTPENFKLYLERLYGDYNLSELVNLRAGRFLTPAGRWNLIHAAPLVWTTSRPLVTSQLFPKAINGVMLYGALPVNNVPLEYSVFGEAIEDFDNNRNEHEFHDSLGFKLSTTGDWSVGVTAMEFNEQAMTHARYRLLGLDFKTHLASWEISGEAMQRWALEEREGGHGAYLQAVLPIRNQWYAVTRVDAYEHPDEQHTNRFILGTAYKPQPNQVFKLEYAGGSADRVDSPKGVLFSFTLLY